MSNKITVNKEIDIRGEVCPYTFVKTKLAIETMNAGQILRILTDHYPAVENVPRSLKGEGHEVLEIEELKNNEWRLTVKKKE
jgi:tRNA 2-thiouridine synthesizing protein A